MTLKSCLLKAGLFILVMLPLFLSGCDNSGYGMPRPYVITGTVTMGSVPVDERVTGTVHVLTNIRADRYQAAIDPVDGSYEVSIQKPDPPYLVWADLDGERTLYSYTSGARNPVIEDDASAENDIPSDEETTEPEKILLPQTVNITPLTDMIIGLAFLEDPQARFLANPNAGFPSESKIYKFHSTIVDLLSDTFDYLSTPENLYAYKDYNLFHDKLIVDDDIDRLFTAFWVQYIDEINPEDRREIKLTLKDGLGEGDEVFFGWDLIKDNLVDILMENGTMYPSEALEILKIVLGI
ncbi:MAG: hypothetical protein KKD44_07740 [Proteobacteria bacterium]|nr:hypothetical protein [Pseudomonadota bacterium]